MGRHYMGSFSRSQVFKKKTCWTSSSIWVLGVLPFVFEANSSSKMFEPWGFSSFPRESTDITFSLLLLTFNWQIGDFTLLLCTVLFLKSLVLDGSWRDVTEILGTTALVIGLISSWSSTRSPCIFASWPFSLFLFCSHLRPLFLAWLLVSILEEVFPTVLVLFEASSNDFTISDT